MIPGKLDTAALAALAPPRDPEPRPTAPPSRPAPDVRSLRL